MNKRPKMTDVELLQKVYEQEGWFGPRMVNATLAKLQELVDEGLLECRRDHTQGGRLFHLVAGKADDAGKKAALFAEGDQTASAMREWFKGLQPVPVNAYSITVQKAIAIDDGAVARIEEVVQQCFDQGAGAVTVQVTAYMPPADEDDYGGSGLMVGRKVEPY